MRTAAVALLVIALSGGSADASATAALPHRPAPMESAGGVVSRSDDVSRVVVRPAVRPLPASDPTRPAVTLPDNPPHTAIQAPVGGAPRHERTIAGTASWYCGHGSACTRGYPGGLYAAAGPALRKGAWRGRTVVVRSNGRSVAVTLIDWCACPNGRLLDLYSDAFGRLAPLSQGVLKVVVSW